MIKAIIHFAFGATPCRSNAKKEEMLDQLKMIDREDTENRIQQALGKVSEYDSSISEIVDQDNDEELLNEIVAEDQERRDVEIAQKEGSGESTLNKTAIMPECVDKERVSEELFREDSSGELVLDENVIMSGCGNAFDPEGTCVVAGCDSCIKNVDSGNHTREKICKCRGRRVTMSAKELSDRIENDWSLREVDTSNPDFEDLIFALPVSCELCGKFISKNIKDMATKEVERDKRRKMKEDPNWIPRNWENLRNVVQNTW